MRSLPLPSETERLSPVKTVVGKNFHFEVTMSDEDVFLEFFEVDLPTCIPTLAFLVSSEHEHEPWI